MITQRRVKAMVFWRYPSRRASLDACLPAEVSEHLLHVWRQLVERVATPVGSYRAYPYCLLQQPTPQVAFHEKPSSISTSWGIITPLTER